MPRYDFTSQRLYVDRGLKAGTRLVLGRGQANYLLNVLRLKAGDHVLLFNGRDGEWRADVEPDGRKSATLVIDKQVRVQPRPFDLHYLFAPLKQARLEYMVQKAVEMGAGVLQPVLTQYTQIRKLNLERMSAHTIEAAEQCGILSLPELHEPTTLQEAVDAMPADRHLIFCDEGAPGQNPLTTLNGLSPGPLAVLIGPEGGFSTEERSWLLKHDNVTAIPLGPRVLRADTAAVAALAIVQAKLGDWND